MISTKNPTNFTAMKAIFSRPITAGFVISWLLLAYQAAIQPSLIRAAPQGECVAVLRGRAQNSGDTEAISSWLPWLNGS
jgi:hypothetical protein